MQNRPSIAAVAPTLATLLGAQPPRDGSTEPLTAVTGAAENVLGVRRVDRALVFCPDALGEHLHGPFAEKWRFLEAPGTISVRLRAELPPKTPVCFASMFTGAPPEVHGIRRYEKPVLTCDTLFDALVRAGRRVAIVAVVDSSIATIFKGRSVDYFDEPGDADVVVRAEALVAESTTSCWRTFRPMTTPCTIPSPSRCAQWRRSVTTLPPGSICLRRRSVTGTAATESLCSRPTTVPTAIRRAG